MARAKSMLGSSGYHLFANNCEHFATWCMTGKHDSAQLQTAFSIASAVVAHQLPPRLAKELVASLGQTAPASAANIVSGLKAIGGSPAGGVKAVAAIGAIAGAGTMYVALGDKPYLTERERAARRAGRVAGIGGAAVAAGGIVYAVGALGVSGYCAARISSGLAALAGGGGGMLAGVAVAATAPVVAAIALALLGFFGMGWLSREGPQAAAVSLAVRRRRKLVGGPKELDETSSSQPSSGPSLSGTPTPVSCRRGVAPENLLMPMPWAERLRQPKSLPDGGCHDRPSCRGADAHRCLTHPPKDASRLLPGFFGDVELVQLPFGSAQKERDVDVLDVSEDDLTA